MDVHFILCFINCDTANLAHDLFKNCPFSPMNKKVGQQPLIYTYVQLLVKDLHYDINWHIELDWCFFNFIL